MYALPDATKDTRFGQLVGSFQGQKTRCRIYACNPQDLIDYSVEANVVNYGTLLKYNANDTDSNSRIASSGLKFTEYFNKDTDRAIGLTATTQISVSFVNDDGAMSSFHWDYDAVVYLDIYDSTNSEWLSCPLGVFDWEMPDQLSSVIVSAKANNFMQRLGKIESSISSVDYSNSPDLYDITYRCYGGGGTIEGITFGITRESKYFPAESRTYNSVPYDDSGMSARDSLGLIAEINYKNAYVDRSASLKFRSWAYLPDNPSRPDAHVVKTFSADITPSHIGSLQIAEYDVPTVNRVIADIGQIGAKGDSSSGNGFETFHIYDNGWFRPKDQVQGLCLSIRGNLQYLFDTTYRPMTVELCEGDPRLEGGDLVNIVKDGTTYLLPVFQQTIEWKGGAFKQTLISTGRRSRKDADFTSSKSHNVSSRIYNASSQSGFITASSVASGSTSDNSVTFDVPFNKNPIVVASIFSSQTTGMGQCSVSVYNITTTGCSIRLTNGYSSARSLGATWIAVSQ